MRSGLHTTIGQRCVRNCAIGIAAATLAGCAMTPSPAVALEDADMATPVSATLADGLSASITAPIIDDIGTGTASWYGQRFAGRPTASGEPFDPADYTAAHRDLPFGSRVLVTYLESGRSVVVRINDRGPWTGGRAIDLSQAAAEELGLVRAGHGEVRLQLLGE